MINGVALDNTYINGQQKKVAIVSGSDAYPGGVHAGQPTGITAGVEPSKTPGHVVAGQQILGTNGTYAGTATHDIEGSAGSGVSASQTSIANQARHAYTMATGTDLDLATKTQVYAAGSLAEIYGVGVFNPADASTVKLRLYADGVQIAEGDWLDNNSWWQTSISGYAALVGSKVIKLSAHNYAAGDEVCGAMLIGANPSPIMADVFGGSVKVV